MTVFHSILLPVFPDQEPLRPDVLDTIKRVAAFFDADHLFVVHLKNGETTQEVLTAIEELSADLCILECNPSVAQAHRKILESLTIPALLLPTEFSGEPLMTSFIVPMSGERKANHALGLALRLATEVNLPVDLLHVTSEEEGDRNLDSALSGLFDEFYHEFPQLIEELIAEASPFSHFLERKTVRELKQSSGEVAREIIKAIHHAGRPLLVVEWSGSYEEGRAETLKKIIHLGQCPVLLVRVPEKMRFRFKVGQNFAA